MAKYPGLEFDAGMGKNEDMLDNVRAVCEEFDTRLQDGEVMPVSDLLDALHTVIS